MARMTRAVRVGDVVMGGGTHVSVQSMTNTRTADIEKTSEQIGRLEEAGCEIVRFAVLDEADARAVRELKARARVPLVADIHFDYRLAILCVENGVDKLRINPGNIGAIERVKAVADCAKAHHVPIRIGVNGGSLEKELLAKYGSPTPQALVESALNHVRLLEKAGYSDAVVISAKSSSVRDTVEAYRLLAERCDYPLHVGVTEAGVGEMGVVKSAAGIGALLIDGIGDTIRVSLTGDPVREVEVGIELLHALGLRCEGVEVISCPTCGRCYNVEAQNALAERVRREFASEKRYLKVAVMGCAVNGPGEAREADVGIAFGKSNAVLFEHGRQDRAGNLPEIADELIARIRARLEQ
jgi:(E)-4-hydroxy-3-methylbut-2-enyl-diphosphate synthase